MLFAVVDESALRRPTGGPEVMHAQLEHLLRQSNQPSITLQVISNNLGAHAGMAGGFSIVEFPGGWDPDVVYVESPAGEHWVEGDPALAAAKMTFRRLQIAALNAEDSRRAITRAIKAIRELPHD